MFLMPPFPFLPLLFAISIPLLYIQLYVPSKVTPAINEDYDWRQIPAYQECRVDIYPSQPSVPSATVAEFFVNDTTVFLNLSLIAPSTPHGAVETYEVVLVREPVPAEEDPLSLNLVRRTLLEVGRM